jgi:hypothetical protein
LGGLADRIGAKGGKQLDQDVAEKRRPPFELSVTPMKAHPNVSYHHKTPFEGRKPQRRDSRQKQHSIFDMLPPSTRRALTK